MAADVNWPFFFTGFGIALVSYLIGFRAGRGL
jgi:hypothetical protein